MMEPIPEGDEEAQIVATPITVKGYATTMHAQKIYIFDDAGIMTDTNTTHPHVLADHAFPIVIQRPAETVEATRARIVMACIFLCIAMGGVIILLYK